MNQNIGDLTSLFISVLEEIFKLLFKKDNGSASHFSVMSPSREWDSLLFIQACIHVLYKDVSPAPSIVCI